MTQTKPTPITQLERLIRSKHPVISIDTAEESRALAAITRVAEVQKKSLFVWKISTGLLRVLGSKATGDPDPAETVDHVAAFQAMSKFGSGASNPQPAIFVMLDLHNQVTRPSPSAPGVKGGAMVADALAVRWIRDIVGVFQDAPHTLILVSPQFDLPLDLQKDIAKLDWPLPTPAELEKILDDCAARVKGKVAASGDKVTVSLGQGIKERLVKALRGLTAYEASNVLSLAVVSNTALDERAIGFVLDEKKTIIAQSGALEWFDTDLTMSDVGGLEILKAYVNSALDTFSDEARAYGVDRARGVIIFGVPGTGKSLIAKALCAGRMPLIKFDLSANKGGLVGATESNTRSNFRIIRAVGECGVWLDEVEKSLGGVSGYDGDGGASKGMFGTILTEMQEGNTGAYFIATANDPSGLPPEFLRRFDKVFFADLPTAGERAQIIGIHLKKRGRNPKDYDLKAVGEACNDFTGAECEKAVVGALRRAFGDGRREVTNEDLLAAAESDVNPIARTMPEKIKSLREWAKGRATPASKAQAEALKVNGGGRELEL